MIIKDITDCLEAFAPLSYQEDYDNAGLLIGDQLRTVEKALFTLDITEAVLDEAIRKQCTLVISHHPLIFHGLKKLTGHDLVQRLVIKAVKNDIAIYAMHTNLDNSVNGLNKFICDKLGLTNCTLLSPAKGKLSKLVTFCPEKFAVKVRMALFDAGAGHIGEYDRCSYNVSGQGTFRASENARPFVGGKNLMHVEEEVRIEVIFPSSIEQKLVASLKKSHPYEEVAFDIYPLSNYSPDAGSGMTGELAEEMKLSDFCVAVKALLNIPVLRQNAVPDRIVRKIAICTGSGGFLIPDAIRSGADVYLTSDLKYHDFFSAMDSLILADIGHYESERFAKDLMVDILIRKFPNFAFLISEINTNPIKYF